MICGKCGRIYNDFRSVCLCGEILVSGDKDSPSGFTDDFASKLIVKPYKDGVEIVSYSSFEKMDSFHIPSIINGFLVRRIGASAFMNSEFVEVTIPPCVLEIGKAAFLSCKKLKNVVLAEGLIKLEERCFCGCEQLNKLILPSSVKYIERELFKYTPIKEFTITKNIKTVPSFFCYGNKTIENIVFEEGVEVIDAYTFTNTKINKIVIPKSVKEVGGGAFENVSIAILNAETKLKWCVDDPPIGRKSKVYCLDGSEALAFCRKNKFNAYPLSDFAKVNEKSKNKTPAKAVSEKNETPKTSQQKKKSNNSDKIQSDLNETIISYEDRYLSRSRLVLVDKKYRIYDFNYKENEKEKYKYLRPIEITNYGTTYKLCGIEDNKVYLIFDKERIMSLSSFEKFEDHIEKAISDYVNNRNAYISKIVSLGEQLKGEEAGLIAQNLAQTLPLDILLEHEILSQFDYILISMIGKIDHHINDSFFLSSELYRNTYLSKLKSKTQQNEINKYIANHKKIYHWKYNEFFDNIHIGVKIEADAESLYSNYFAKYLEYIRQYYSSEIECISKEFSNAGYPTKCKEKKVISIYLAYYMLKNAFYDIAKKEHGAILVEKSGYTIRKYATILKDKFDGGFINARTMGMFVLALMDNGVFNSNDYIGNYKKFESEFNKLQQKNDIEKFREKFASKGVTKTYTLKDIDLMTGIEFENFLCDLFQKMGYHTLSTKASGDQGIDVIAEKDSMKIGIQAKCYTGTVGNSAVQEAVAGKIYYACDKVMVITNSRFTKAAIDLAKANNVILWDRDMLKENL